MPYYYFKEIRTPLKLIGIRFMRDDQGALWYKVWFGPRKQLNQSRKSRKNRRYPTS
ncbi:hypothetical protein [Cohnella fermenti]|uniref:hypothetical protein n=1 Tax=Cohnella fermenti TaxID=2565925 RepID=UPI001454D703|nr:hypothetical protein [Cohnella fermenti]